jgi:hypothetical protein
MRIRRNSNKTNTAPTSNVYSSDNSLLALDVIQRPVHGSKDLSPFFSSDPLLTPVTADPASLPDFAR